MNDKQLTNLVTALDNIYLKKECCCCGEIDSDKLGNYFDLTVCYDCYETGRLKEWLEKNRKELL